MRFEQVQRFILAKKIFWFMGTLMTGPKRNSETHFFPWDQSLIVLLYSTTENEPN